MKHRLRKEKICLNCGARVEENYCPHCGQENIEPHQSFSHLLYHFFSDFTHFDSKFFTTIKDLLLKPGFLTNQYIAGKRKRYLDPVKMYIFISFVFFLTMGLVSSSNDNEPGEVDRQAVATALELSLDSLKASPDMDTATLSRIANSYKNIQSGIYGEKYTSIKAYDSAQERLSVADRDSRIEQYITRKRIKWNNKYSGEDKGAMKEKLLHDVPKVMFVLLPLFALFLKALYRKKYYYSDHAIFSLHFHSLAFLVMLILLLIDHFFGTHFFSKAFIIVFFYLVMALHNMYHQSVGRSFFKGIVLTTMYLTSIIFVIIVSAIVIFLTI